MWDFSDLIPLIADTFDVLWLIWSRCSHLHADDKLMKLFVFYQAFLPNKKKRGGGTDQNDRQTLSIDR